MRRNAKLLKVSGHEWPPYSLQRLMKSVLWYFSFSRGKSISCFSLVRFSHSQRTNASTHNRHKGLMSSESISRLINRKQIAHNDTVAQEFKRRSYHSHEQLCRFYFRRWRNTRGYIARHLQPNCKTGRTIAFYSSKVFSSTRVNF